MTTYVFAGTIVLCLFLLPTMTHAALPLGTLQNDGPATPEQIALLLPVTGSLTNDATATVRYRQVGNPTWTTGHPMFRIRPDHTNTSGAPGGISVVDDFAWPIIDLQPGTSYQVEVTVDDGTETDVRTGTFTTRSLPPAAGPATITIPAGSSRGQIESLINSASPGDVVQFQNGTYDLGNDDIIVDINGSAAQPIYVRGESRDGVIIQNGSPRVFYFVQPSSYAVFENMTLQGQGEDRGTSATPAIQFFSTTPAHHHMTFRNMTINGHDKIMQAVQTLESMLIYDNTFIGNNQWEQDFYPYGGSGVPGAGDGTPDVDQNLFWNDDGVNLPGIGHAVFNNTLRGFGDSLSMCSHAGSNATAECRNSHFYRNEIYESGDDCAEIDYAFRNVTMYDNRCTNGMTAASLDNGYGGPFLIARNTFINIGRSPFKFNGTVSGKFLYNNTTIITDHDPVSAGWIQFNNGSVRSWGYRNNIFIYQNPEGRTYWNEASGHNPIDFTHNSWYPDGRFTWNNSGGGGNTLNQAFQSLSVTTPIFGGQTQRHFADNIITEQPFTQTIDLPITHLTEFMGQALEPTLSAGSPARASGIAIPNITDGFSGGAPDRGAFITGRTNALIGDSSSATTTPPSTERPSVSFAASGSNAILGGRSILYWVSTSADSCSASGSWSGSKARIGIQMVMPSSGNNTYTLTCTNTNGSDTENIVIFTS